MYYTALRIFFCFCAALGCVGGPLPTASSLVQKSHVNILRQPPSQFQHVFDLKKDFAPRDVLLGTGDGLLLTCIDCTLDGAIELSGTLDFDLTVMDQLLSELSGEASSIASQATAVAASEVSVITSAAVGLATAATSALASIAGAIGSEITGAAPPITSAAAQLGSAIAKGAGDVKSALGNIFAKKDLARRDLLADGLQQLMRGVRLQAVQQRTFNGDFALEIATGNEAISIQFPVPFPKLGLRGAALDDLQSIPILGVLDPAFELSILFQPLSMRMAASLAPNINITLGYGANVSLADPIELGFTSVSGGNLQVVPRIGDIHLNSIDPEFCLSAAIGPSFGMRLRHVPTNTQANFSVSLNLPQLSICLDKNENVNEMCNMHGPPIFSNALHVNGTLDIGVELKAGIKVLGVEIPVPGLDDLSTSSLTKTFPLLDRCFDLDSISPSG